MNSTNTITRIISYGKDIQGELHKNRAVASRYMKDAYYLNVIQSIN